MKNNVEILFAVYGKLTKIDNDTRLIDMLQDDFLFLFDKKNQCISVISKKDLIDNEILNNTGEIFSKKYER